MIDDWQPLELPLGLGLDSNSNRAQLPPGQLRGILNLTFDKARELRKRFGFDTHLADLAGGGQVHRFKNHLLARVGQHLYDYALPSTGVLGAGGSFLDRGVFRSVPTRTRLAKSTSVDIPGCSAVTAGNFTLLTWLEGTLLRNQIIDETTQAIVGGVDLAVAAGTTDFHTIGQVNSGNYFFVVAYNGKIIAATGTPGGGTWSWSAITTQFASATHVRLCVDPGGVFHLAANGSGATDLCLARFSVAGSTPTITVTNSATALAATDKSALGIVYFANLSVITIAYRSATNVLTVDLFDPVTCAAGGNVNTLASPDPIQHLGLVTNGVALTVLYDTVADVGTTTAKVYQFAAAGGGPTGVLFRGASLVSDGVYVGSTCYFALMYSVLVSSNLSNAISAGATLADGSVMSAAQRAALALPTLNATTYIATLDGQVCARVLRAGSLTMRNTSSIAVTTAGLIVASRAVSLADTINIQQALSFGAAALINFDVNQEVSRTTEAFKLLFDAGGSPVSFDGTTAAEHGFSLYPEIVLCLDNININVQAVAANTSYNLGSLVYSGGTGEGTTVAMALDQAAVWIVVTPGKTSGVAPTFYVTVDGSLVTNGTCTFQRVGPRQIGAWGTGVVTHAGYAYTPTVANGFWYVMTQTVTDTNHLPAESTINWASATTAGAIVTAVGGGGVASQEGHALTLVCMGPVLNTLPVGKGYSFAACYAWVNDQGQLQRSALSPIQSVTTVVGTPILAMSSLRLTNKPAARIELYSTSGDGTVLQLIAILANNSGVDIVAYMDRVQDATQQTGAICYQGSMGASGVPNVPPPSCSMFCTFGQRVACNNLENPYAVHLSQLAVDGYAVAWSDQTIRLLNGQYGALNALMQMDDKLVLFQDRAISVLTGDGPDNTGGGSDFEQIRVLATDVGCQDATSLLLTPMGIVFRSPKGFYLLDRSTGLNYLGEPIETISALKTSLLAALVDPTTRQVLLLASNNLIYVYNFQRNQWAVWSVQTSSVITGLCEWQGKLVVLTTAGGVYLQSGVSYLDPNGTKVATQFEIAGARLNGVQGFGRVRGFKMLLESSTGAGLTVQVKNDFTDTVVQTTSQQTIAAPMDSYEVRLAHQKMTAIGLVVSETTAGDDLAFLGLTFDVGILAGTARKNPLTKRNF